MDFMFCRYVPKMLSFVILNVLTGVLLNVFVSTQAYNSWLVIGNIALSSPFGRHICDQISLTPQQRPLCERSPGAMESVRDGARLGIKECQFQFRNNRWNCSTISKTSVINDQIVQRGSQEAAFVHAITSAGVTYAVTQACSRGYLEDCSCDKRKRGKSGNDSFVWGGCSDDIRYGMKFAKDFIDACEMGKHDARANMNRHNNNVGRRAVRKFVRRKCKCHGPTTSCPTRTCWDELEDFRRTGEYLKSRYDKAARVTVRQDGSIVKLNPKKKARKRNKKPKKDQLVFLEESPNYCVHNPATGSLGTSGRECNNTSKGEDSCEHLCCGRGYDTMRVTRVEQCHCKFHWCCKVICQNCSQELDVHTCKPEVQGSRNSVISADAATHSSNLNPISLSSTTKKSKGERKGKRRNRRRKKKNRKRGRKRRKKTGTKHTSVTERTKRGVYEVEVDLNELLSSESTLQHQKSVEKWDNVKSRSLLWVTGDDYAVSSISAKKRLRRSFQLSQKNHLREKTFEQKHPSRFSVLWKQFWQFVFGGT